MFINLFSIFDPATSLIFSINWFSCLNIFFYFPLIYWFVPSRWNIFIIVVIEFLVNEFKVLINKELNLLNLLIYISLFYIIIINNFLGIFSYIFTSTSHLVIRLSFSLSLWISYILFGWINFTNHMFVHLVPQGTPSVLIVFMVLIESVRNLIRPGTLAVRLAANIIAGHLLITLISSTGNSLNLLLLILILFRQSLLIILEIRVSVIQAYVFSVLRTLYSTETS